MRGRGSWVLLVQLVAYATVFMVPVLLVSILSYAALVDNARDAVLTSHLELVNQLRATTEREFDQLHTVVLQIQENPALARYRVQDDLVAGRRVIESLKNYALPNALVRNVFLYYRGGKYLFSDQSTFLPAIYINHVHRYDSWSESQFLYDISYLSAPRIVIDRLTVVQERVRTPVAIYMAPLPTGVDIGPPVKVVFFVIDLERMSERLDELAAAAGLPIAIFDRAGTLVASSRTMTAEGLVLVTRNFDASARHEADDHRIIESTSDFPPWRYVAVVAEDSVISALPRLRARFVTILGIVVCVGIVVIVLMTRVTYRPIRMLRVYAQEVSSVQRADRSEIETIRAALDDTVQAATRLEREMITTRPSMGEQLLREILSGRVRDPAELDGRSGANTLCLPGPFFVVALIHIPPHSSFRDRESVAIAVSRATLSGAEANSFPAVDQDTVIAVCSLAASDSVRLQETMRAVHDTAATGLGAPVSVSAGAVRRDLREMPSSYREAKIALDFRHAGMNDDVLLYTDLLPEHLADFRYPMTAIEDLAAALHSGDAPRADYAVDAIVRFVRSERPPVFVVRQLRYDVLGVLTRAGRPPGGDPSCAIPGPDDLASLMEVDLIGDFVSSIRRQAAEVAARRAQEVTDSSPDARGARIVEYIRRHFADRAFSAGRVAEQFGVSLSSLTRIVKDRKGITFSEYVGDLRLGKAKRLLQSTDMSLEQVTRTVGYFNVSSFVRKFRTETGMTPGAYRRMEQERGVTRDHG
ncbi:MAG: helix-turn-helix domain-containing protein [bacterium]